MSRGLYDNDNYNSMNSYSAKKGFGESLLLEPIVPAGCTRRSKSYGVKERKMQHAPAKGEFHDPR